MIQDLVRDDKKTKTEPLCHAELVSASGLFFLPSADAPFIPVPAYRRQAQDGVFRCDLNKFELREKLRKKAFKAKEDDGVAIDPLTFNTNEETNKIRKLK